MIWPHLFSTILFFLCPFFVHSTPQILAIYLPTNMSNLLVTWVLALFFFLCLECSLLRCTAWLSPFHHLDFKFLERPTLTTLMLLSSCPRHTCNNLFYFSPNTYNSFYLYTCLWSVFPSNLFRAVSSATR